MEGTEDTGDTSLAVRWGIFSHGGHGGFFGFGIPGDGFRRVYGQPIYWPEGAEEISPGFTLGTRSNVTALKGLPSYRDVVPGLSSAGAPSGHQAINPKPRVNPGLCFPGPSGQTPLGQQTS
jgi:hypothetical protein